MKVLEKIVFWQFALLLFLVPLILWPFTSEVFEFNKIVLVYILTTSITATWMIKMVIQKKFIFRRTILDIPLTLFLGSQAVSTIFSIDPLTSFLGYYSRFNGGLLSTVCYSLLYWAFVSNIDLKKTLKLLYITLGSAALVGIYGVLEHFGIDKNVWQQDVASRVFSTLGQPNWLAAWVVALIPVVWAITTKFTEGKIKLYKSVLLYSLSALLYIVLLFTGSRSGLLGFIAADIIFWGLALVIYKKRYLKHFIISNAVIIVISLILGTQWTPSIKNLIGKSKANETAKVQTGATSLETGGTESSTIRKIVWKGAFQVWLHYPVFGTGVETFAYSYYLYRPVEHNLTSEWDFIYNKAHNEYLNMAANSGTFGLLTYLTLLGFTLYVFAQRLGITKRYEITPEIDNWRLLIAGLSAGYVSILITNFFGFSVVPIQLEFFLFPAIAIILTKSADEGQEQKTGKIIQPQKTAISMVLILALFIAVQTVRYWQADYYYNTGKGYDSLGKPDVATTYLGKAINLEPNQPLYHSELATSYINLALALNQQKETTQAAQLSTAAISEIQKAINLSPANVNFRRIQFGVFVMLSTIDPNYLINARDTLIAAIAKAPTDAKLYYNLALIYARTGQNALALQTLVKTIDLKANYKEARLAYSILLIANKQNAEAKTQLEYILTKIDPNDSLTKQTLESIK